MLRVGDILAFKRNFLNINLVIEKDAIVCTRFPNSSLTFLLTDPPVLQIQSINPKTHVPTVLFEPGTTRHLPAPLLLPDPADPSGPTLSAAITSPTMLETALLDTDARIGKPERPNGNAWKCFTIWRRRGEYFGNADDERGGRENHGTLFYLRGTYYHELIVL